MKKDIKVLDDLAAKSISKGKPAKENFVFSAVLFALLGWLILESWLIANNKAIRLHITASAFGAWVMTFSLLRFRATHGNFRLIAKTLRPLNMADIFWHFALAILGVIFGVVATSEYITPVVFIVLLYAYTPWMKIKVCQQGIVMPLLTISISAIFSLFIYAGKVPLIMALVAVWSLWTSAALICASLCIAEIFERKG